MGNAARTSDFDGENELKDYGRLVHRLTDLLFTAQSLGSAGLIAATTVNAIVCTNLTGQPALAGLRSATYIFGGAFASLAWGHTMERICRHQRTLKGV